MTQLYYIVIALRCFSTVAQWKTRIARKVLNYFIRFYMLVIPFLMAYSISDNTTFSTTRKIVSYHREMVSPCTAISSLSLFFFFFFSLLLLLSTFVFLSALPATTGGRPHWTHIHVNEFQT